MIHNQFRHYAFFYTVHITFTSSDERVDWIFSSRLTLKKKYLWCKCLFAMHRREEIKMAVAIQFPVSVDILKCNQTSQKSKSQWPLFTFFFCNKKRRKFVPRIEEDDRGKKKSFVSTLPSNRKRTLERGFRFLKLCLVLFQLPGDLTYIFLCLRWK